MTTKLLILSFTLLSVQAYGRVAVCKLDKSLNGQTSYFHVSQNNDSIETFDKSHRPLERFNLVQTGDILTKFEIMQDGQVLGKIDTKGIFPHTAGKRNLGYITFDGDDSFFYCWAYPNVGGHGK